MSDLTARREAWRTPGRATMHAVLDAVIIGGGVGGLATAFRLRERLRAGGRDPAIAVLERSARWGGVMRSRVEHGCVLEEGPDSILRALPAGMALLHDLGLDGEVQETEPDARRSLIARGDRLLPIPEGLYLLAPGRIWPFLRSSALSWPGKLRALGDLVLPRRPADVAEESLAAFVRRRLGRETLARLAQPLASGIHTGDPERLSVDAAFPQLVEMERASRSLILALRARRGDAAFAAAAGPRYALFASLRGGLGRMIEVLIERLAGCDLRLDAPALAIERDGDAWCVRLDGGAALRARTIALAGPAHAAATVARAHDGELADALDAIEYSGVATINLGYAADAVTMPKAAGFVVPAIEGRALIAATFANQKYGGRAPAGLSVIRGFVGGALGEHRLTGDDATLIAQAVDDLRPLLRARAAPRFASIHRWPRSMAQPTLGHNARVARIRELEARHHGLALVGNGYEGVGIPQICEQAARAAERLAREIR